MTHFAVGEQVVIRYGGQQGQKAIILPSRLPDAYKVRGEDGCIRFYSGKGLEQEPERVHQVVS